MKIVLVGPFPPFRGGISDLNVALAHHLSKRHEIHAINFTTQYPKVLFPGKTQYKKGDYVIRQGEKDSTIFILLKEEQKARRKQN